MIEAPKQVSLILPYNFNGCILLQDRREISKWGEEYGLFGGRVEEGENPEQALERELREELELSGVEYALFKRYEHSNKELGVTVLRNIYLSQFPDLTKIVCHEGKPVVKHFRDRFDLKMIVGFNELLDEIYHSLITEKKITE